MQKQISRAQAEPEGKGEPNQTKPRTGGQPNKPNKTQNQPPQGEGEGRLPTADMPKQDGRNLSQRRQHTTGPGGKNMQRISRVPGEREGKRETKHKPKPKQQTKPKPQPTATQRGQEITRTLQMRPVGTSDALTGGALWPPSTTREKHTPGHPAVAPLSQGRGAGNQRIRNKTASK